MSAPKSTDHAGQARLENGQRIVLPCAVATGNQFLQNSLGLLTFGDSIEIGA